MRLVIILISLGIIVSMFFIYINRSIAPVPEDLDLGNGIEISEDDTIIDTIDYAQDAVDKANLQTCQRLCAGDIECQADCLAQ